MDNRTFTLFLGAVTSALTTSSPERLGDLLAPDVVWDGIHPGQRCSGPVEIVERLSRGLGSLPRIDRLEIGRSGVEATVRAEGHGFVELLPSGESVPRPAATLIFRFRDGLVVHIQSA